MDNHFLNMARLCLKVAESMAKERFSRNSGEGKMRTKNRWISDETGTEISRAIKEPRKTVVVEGPSSPLNMPEALKSEVRVPSGPQKRLMLNMNITRDVPESSCRKRTASYFSDTASSSGGEKKKQKPTMNRPPSDGAGKEKFRERKPKKIVIIAGPIPPPDMPEALRSEVRVLGGTQVRLLLQKDLTECDVARHQGRLSMPVKQLGSDDFLDEEEKAKAIPRQGIDVTVIYQTKAGLEVEKTQLSLRRWVFNSSSSYVLVHNWGDVVTSYCLEKDNIVQVWFFRNNNGKPCFVLVKL